MRPKAKWAIDSEPIRARGIKLLIMLYHTTSAYLELIFLQLGPKCAMT